MTIYVVRHAETEWNREGRRQGHADSPLTERGRNQALGIGKILARELTRGRGQESQSAEICSSPLGRALETAAIACRALGIDAARVVPEPLLIECDHGDWTGLTNAEIEARDSAGLRARNADKWHTRMPGGECYADLDRRARDWLQRFASVPDPHPAVVAVTHDMFGRALRGAFLGLHPEEMLGLTQAQGTVIRLEQAGGARTSLELAG